jgi:hypothetical protein
MGDRRGAEKALMERPDRKRPLGRHGCGYLAQDRNSWRAVGNEEMNSRTA